MMMMIRNVYFILGITS